MGHQGTSIRPVIEYYPIDWIVSRQGATYEFLDSKEPRQKELKALLMKKRGIYLFYDSMGKAIYIGKAKRQSLYAEMKSAYNRNRFHNQKIWIVQHVSQQRIFDPAKEAARQITHKPMALHDIASYFSAFEVDLYLIDNIEALLIRSFANQLTNKRKERFKLD